jgi:hypothetical protein
MPATYDRLASTTLSSNQSTVTFSSIDQTYTDLVVQFRGNVLNSNQQIWMRLNGDSSGNYTYIGMYSGSALAYNSASVSATACVIGGIGDGFTSNSQSIGSVTANINNYAATNIFKTVIARDVNRWTNTGLTCSSWFNTSAITSITLSGSSAAFEVGTSITIYGIKRA